MNVPALHIVTLIGYATLMAAANIILEAAAHRFRAGPNATIVDLAFAAATNPYLLVGLAIYGFAFFFWIWLLSFIPLRYAYPITAAGMIIIVPLLSGILKMELPPPLYWVGLVVVTIGLSLVVIK